MSSVERQFSRATALWATGSGHGRSPALTMRHTVDDKLQVATHVSFLSLRAMMHRNRDSIVLLSEELIETKLCNPSTDESSVVDPSRRSSLPPAVAAFTTVSRSLILTDRHCYCVSMPGVGLFATASTGGCFQWSELSRVLLSAPAAGGPVSDPVETNAMAAAAVPSSSITRGRHIVLQFLNGIVALQSQTTAAARRVADVVYGATGVKAEEMEREEETVASVKQRIAQSTSRGGAAAVYAASVAPSHGMASASSVRSSRPGAAAASVGTTMETGRSAESVLRRLVDAQIAADVRRNAPEVGCQTEPQGMCDASCSIGCSSSHLVTRSTSPFEVDPRLLSFADPEMASDRTGSTAAESDFDAKDVWKSLRTVPPKGVATTTTTTARPSRSGTSPGRHGPGSKSVSPSGRAAGVGASASMNRSTREADDDDDLLASTRRDLGRSATTSPSFGAKPSGAAMTTSSFAVAGASVASPSAGGTGSGVGTTWQQQQQQQQQQDASTSPSASLDDFLGVLSVYRPVFSRLGYHSATQFAKLSDAEVDQLLDAAGVVKQGHRMLLHSKLALGRQQQQQALRTKR